MAKEFNGSCNCGEIKFKAYGDVSDFVLCHCSYCKKDTGSGNASNIFLKKYRMTWIGNQLLIRNYNIPNTLHSKSFCAQCGSALPFEMEDINILMLPAGSIDEDLDVNPRAHIFSSNLKSWEEDSESLIKYEKLPL